MGHHVQEKNQPIIIAHLQLFLFGNAFLRIFTSPAAAITRSFVTGSAALVRVKWLVLILPGREQGVGFNNLEWIL